MSGGPAVQGLLEQLHALPGVVGALLCDERGRVLADHYRVPVDPSASQRAAEILADNAAGLAAIGGPVGILSVRLGDARLVVRAFAGGSLLLLCAPGASTAPLGMMTASLVPKLERLVAVEQAPPPAATPPPILQSAPLEPPTPAASAPAAGQLHRAVQRIEAAIARKKLDAPRTRGAIALAAGFSLRCIDEDTPDDPARLSQLQAAAAAVLGEKV